MIRGELSPLDGRYSQIVSPIREVCSERSLVQHRIDIEIRYLEKLLKTLGKPVQTIKTPEIDRVFEIEHTTNHDVKAVEIAIREQLTPESQKDCSSLVHFALTSQDINSTAVVLQVRNAVNIILKELDTLIVRLEEKAGATRGIVMLAHTHGQPATPTTLGNEYMVFVERLKNAASALRDHKWSTKFGGATGGFNAHYFVYPNVDWPKFADEFISECFDMERQQHTTQIEHYDGLAAVFHAVSRLDTILVDLCSDMWHYISLGYLRQSARVGTVGSSAMPHKINPIQFENAEGNLLLANNLFDFMARKFPVSRMQRDLTDSTVTRNIGTAFGHAMIGLVNVQRGLLSVAPNRQVIDADLEAHPEVITEGLQCVLRSEGNDEAYEAFRVFSRENPGFTHSQLKYFLLDHFIESPNINEMLMLLPCEYRPCV